MNINHGSGSEDEENETIELNPEDILEVIDIDDDDAPGDGMFISVDWIYFLNDHNFKFQFNFI